MTSTEVLAELTATLPSDAVIVDRDVTRSLSHDEAEWAPVGEPLALIRATSSDHVAAVVRICARFGVPVTARGAGTGLSGGANAIEGGVIIALDRLNQIRLIDPLERLAVVQAGVINDELRATAAEQGLWYPPDPASSPWSTIGGNIATNAGGVCCVKYGVTKDYVLALEVVTGTGELVRLGRATAKGVAGYDLVALMVGSEGTLGIITEATVRLKPLPAASRTIVGYFGSIVDAGEAARAVAKAGIIPSALELIDRHCLAAVDQWKNMGLSVEADVVLLGRIDDPGMTGDDARRSDAGLLRGRGCYLGGPVERRGGGRGALRRAPPRVPGARAAGSGADRRRVRADRGGTGHAGAYRADRQQAQHPDREHCPHRRRQSAPVAHRRPGRRCRPGSCQDRLRGDPQRCT